MQTKICHYYVYFEEIIHLKQEIVNSNPIMLFQCLI